MIIGLHSTRQKNAHQVIGYCGNSWQDILLPNYWHIRSKQYDKWKIPNDCGKCHMKHDVTILLTRIPTILT